MNNNLIIREREIEREREREREREYENMTTSCHAVNFVFTPTQ